MAWQGLTEMTIDINGLQVAGRATGISTFASSFAKATEDSKASADRLLIP
jgi:hypothetical protein